MSESIPGNRQTGAGRTRLRRADGDIVRMDPADHLPLITGVRVQLQQVIHNLIRNAAGAMRKINGRSRNLSIIADQDEEGRVRLIVKDTGIGFDPKETDRMFEAFYFSIRRYAEEDH